MTSIASWAVISGVVRKSRYAPLPANIVKADEAKLKSITYDGKPIL